MKKRNLVIVPALFILPVIFGSCEKCNPDCDLVAAKIIRYDCDRVIFQLLTSETIGDASWEDVYTGETYTNVVSFYNTCKIATLTSGEKTTVYVSIRKPGNDPVLADCYQCLALSKDPPHTKVDFAEISATPCEPATNR